jgi:protocatechuate 3,4-dioxygenase beta subunit
MTHGEPHNDDLPIGRLLNRREALLALAGAGAAVALAACAPGSSLASTAQATATTGGSTGTTSGSAPSYVARPALTEGPYFVDERLNRSDIRTDPSDGSVRQGTLLALTFRVSQLTTACAPLAGASVDVWQCDAAGVYSDVRDQSFNTVGKKFLRGYQVADGSGVAKFTTIYPGWYQGRTVHIHFKIRSHTGSGAAYEFTSQLFFDDAITDKIYAQPPYSAKGQRTLRNEGDGIYNQGGRQLLLTPTKTTEGYSATFAIGLQMA